MEPATTTQALSPAPSLNHTTAIALLSVLYPSLRVLLVQPRWG